MRIVTPLLTVLTLTLALAAAGPGQGKDRHDGDPGDRRGDKHAEQRSAPPPRAAESRREPQYSPPAPDSRRGYDPNDRAPRYSEPRYNDSRGYDPRANWDRDGRYEMRRDLPPSDPESHPVRGRFLPRQHWDNVVTDPGRYRVRRAPPGYRWVYVGRDLFLVQSSSGLIVDQIEGGRY